jgi:spermidine dehydrogenase
MLEHLGIDPHVVKMYDSSGYLFCVGNDAVPALYAWEMRYPGFDGLGLEPTPPERLIAEPGGQHGRENDERAESGDPTMYFPDGNATITRLLVAKLIPDAVPAHTMEDVVTAKADYSKLDVPGVPTRIRLDSTVVAVRNGERDVAVTYVRGGDAKRVRARGAVMACWNSVIPYLCPELPQNQREALAYGVKSPLCYTNVLISNWSSWVKSGVFSVSAPGCYHQAVRLGHSLELGGYRSSQDPDDPIVLRMMRYPNQPGLSRREQHKAGRRDLLSTTFETFEREIREQLNRTLSPAGFDAARDIVAITVNRWPHGYTYTYNTLFDNPDWALETPEDRPAVVGRKPFGRVTIANADSAASPHTDAAIDEAYRAVNELRDRLT